MPDLDRPNQKVFDLIESGSAKLVHKELFRIRMGLSKKAFYRIWIRKTGPQAINQDLHGLSKMVFYRIRIRKTGPQVIIPDLDGSELKGLLSKSRAAKLLHK
jgi:hypothetical protein